MNETKGLLMKKTKFKLSEAAAFLDIPVKRIQVDSERGHLATTLETIGKKTYRFVTIEALSRYQQKDNRTGYGAKLTQYWAELRAGTIGTAPCSEAHIANMGRGMDWFWQHCKRSKTIANVSADNFRAAMLDIPIDNENHRDYHPKRLKMYEAVTGFMRLLIREGFKTKGDLEALKELKPRRKFKPLRDYPTAEMVQTIIEKNLNRTRGRRTFDIEFMNTLLHLYAYTGIRKMEAAMLEVKDVSLAENALRVWGKGGKRRKIPIAPTLKPVLEKWLKIRPESDEPYLLLQQDGSPVTGGAIACRFKRLTAATGTRIHPHALRHSCATFLANDGMPVPLISHMLGHSDTKITELYMNVTEADLFKWFAKPKKAATVVKKKRAARSVVVS